MAECKPLGEGAVTGNSSSTSASPLCTTVGQEGAAAVGARDPTADSYRLSLGGHGSDGGCGVDGPHAALEVTVSYSDVVEQAPSPRQAMQIEWSLRNTGRGLHSSPYQLNLSSSVHRNTQLNS